MSRMQQLHQLLEKTPNDAFLLYGIALEHKKAGEPQPAIEYLNKTIAVDAKYCYAYYQKGQIYESIDDFDAARGAYKAGLAAARSAGDAHAASEIEAALEMLD
jgi:tetratricopeptide (TPR) repeat protein